MSCPHTETTAVLAAFGEAPPEYDAHLHGCAECQTVVDAHTETLAVLATSSPALPAANERPWHRNVAVVLLAAAVLIGIGVFGAESDPVSDAVESPVPETQHVHTTHLSFESSLDDELAELELDLALMTLE